MNFIRKILTNPVLIEDGNFFIRLKQIIRFKPKNKLLQKGIYTSFYEIKDKKGNPYNYERLEFVGDAMLGSVIASYLYKSTTWR